MSTEDNPPIGDAAKEALRSLVERIERLAEEKQALADDIKEVYAEAKATGFDVKTIRQVIKMRKMEDHERQEQEAIVDLYAFALNIPRG